MLQSNNHLYIMTGAQKIERVLRVKERKLKYSEIKKLEGVLLLQWRGYFSWIGGGTFLPWRGCYSWSGGGAFLQLEGRCLKSSLSPGPESLVKSLISDENISWGMCWLWLLLYTALAYLNPRTIQTTLCCGCVQQQSQSQTSRTTLKLPSAQLQAKKDCKQV